MPKISSTRLTVSTNPDLWQRHTQTETQGHGTYIASIASRGKNDTTLYIWNVGTIGDIANITAWFTSCVNRFRCWETPALPWSRLLARSAPRYVAAPALGVNTRSRRSSIAAVHCRRPCLSRGRGASVEQPARFRHGVNVAAHVQATLAVSDDFNTFHRTSFYLRLILSGVLAVVLTLCHLSSYSFTN